MSPEDRHNLWLRADNTKTRNELTSRALIACEIYTEWLTGKEYVDEIWFKGDFLSALRDLYEAAKVKKLNAPITSLRVLLMSRVDGLISLERELGIVRKQDSTKDKPAITMFAVDEELIDIIKDTIASCINDWLINTVQTWSKRHELDDIIDRFPEEVTSEHIEIIERPEKYIEANGKINYPIITNAIAKNLTGEELFPGLSPCELVLSPVYSGNTIELMTLPQRALTNRQKKDFFSMVARLSIVTVPYSKGLYLSVNVAKRVWAGTMPSTYSHSNKATAYIMSEARPAIPVEIRKHDNEWNFSPETYSALRLESKNTLPENLEQAVKEREFNKDTGWWAGLQQLPSLYNYMSPRSVFECDEQSLLENVTSRLEDIVLNKPIDLIGVKLPSKAPKSMQEMLKLSDFGMAGAIFYNEELDLDYNDNENETSNTSNDEVRQDKLETYRDQNLNALRRVHGEHLPTIWMFGGNQHEQTLTEQIVRTLFGEGITFNYETLPEGTHGLKNKLELPDKTARERFDNRVEKWSKVTSLIKAENPDTHNVILICAPDRIDRKPEDIVNYYAGIHAGCLIGANVHHVLPIDNIEDEKLVQSFLYRAQNALLDVMLAHTGSIFGVKEFIDSLDLKSHKPDYVYGIQAVYSRAQRFSGQSNVEFIQYTRLSTQTGQTEIRFIVHDSGKNIKTDWQPLENGLTWLGTQRRILDTPKNWLKIHFEQCTIEFINEINQTDPNAIVLIDWATVQSLWRGITDFNINNGKPPQLGELNLERLKNMTFVRIRHGKNTITLRSKTSSLYKRLDDGAFDNKENEQYRESGYMAAMKSIVKFKNTSCNDTARCAHFIGSMGYPKTVTLPRGLSCYRDTSRMKQDATDNTTGTDEKVFKWVTSSPCDKDASLPAPMDITILTCPEGLKVDNYAKLVMGLRVGFAHYNDWTKLPAPLFFIRKVRDYIMRYKDEAGDEVAVDTGVIATNSQMSDLVVNDIYKKEDTSVISVEENKDAQPDISNKKTKTINLSEDADLLTRAKNTELPLLADMKGKQYRHLRIGMFNSYHDVNVEIPEWVNTNDLFVTNAPITKYSVRRCWDFMNDNGYVRHGQRKVSPSQFLKWLSVKVRSPQACISIVSITKRVFGITLKEFATIINTEYNKIVDQEEQVDPFSFSEEDILNLTTWAMENKHDILLGWILFLQTQFPVNESNDEIFDLIDEIIGPRTERALEYYIATAETINQLLNEQPNKKYVLHKKLPIITHAIDNNDTINEASIVKPQSQEGGIAFMKTKQQIIDLLEAIDIEADNFEEKVSNIRDKLNSLVNLHQDYIDAKETAKLIDSKLETLINKQAQLKASINNLDREFEIEYVESNVISIEQVEIIEEELNDIEKELQSLVQLFELYIKIQKNKPTGLAEGQKHIQEVSDALTKVTDCTENLRNLITKGICFSFIKNSPINDGGESQTQEVQTTTVETEDASKEESTGDISSESDVVDCQGDSKQVENVQKEDTLDTGLSPIENGDISSNIIDDSYAEEDLSQSSDDKPGDVVPDKVEPKQSSIEHEAESASEFIAKQFSDQISTLHKFIEARLYGLAEVQIAALGKLVEKTEFDELKAHHYILQSLNNSLYQMDCRDNYNIGVNNNFKEIIESSKISTGMLADPTHMAFGMLAAGLPNLIFDQKDRWIFLQPTKVRFVDIKPLSNLMQMFDEITRFDYQLNQEVIQSSQVGDDVARSKEIERCQKRAENWSNDPKLHITFRHAGYRNVNKTIFSRKCMLGKCLQMIANNERNPSVLSEAFQDTKSSKLLHEAITKRGEHIKPDGLYRDHVIENIRTTKEFIKNYIELLNDKTRASSNLTPDMESFLEELNKKLVSAKEAIQKQESDQGLETLYHDAAIHSINLVLRLFEKTPEQAECVPFNAQKLLIQLPLDKELMPVINELDNQTKPLCLPQAVFEELDKLSEEGITLDDDDNKLEDRLIVAFQGHITKDRLLPANLINEYLGITDQAKQKSFKQKLHKTKQNFLNELHEANANVIHALTLNALPSNDFTSRMQNTIGELMHLTESDNPPGTPDVDSSIYVDYPHVRAALEQNVLNPLDERFKIAREEIEVELLDAEQDVSFNQTDIAKIRSMLESNNPARLRAAHDALNHLKTEHKLPDKIETIISASNEFDEIINKLRNETGTKSHMLTSGLRELLLIECGSASDSKLISHLDNEQRQEAIEFIDNWVDFFKKEDVLIEDNFATVFRAFGITDLPIAAPDNNRHDKRASLLMSNQNFREQYSPDVPTFVPPVLGSWADMIPCHILWGNVNKNDIMSTIHNVSSGVSIIMARTTLLMDDRAEVSGTSPVLIIDDNLVAYMALHPKNRKEALLRVGIQTFHTNPYNDHGTKPVPSEMFFGRKTEIDRLVNISGVAVLFGGRRLGKTSLLYEVADRVRKTPLTSAVLFSLLDIDTDNIQQACWESVYRFLESDNLIPSIELVQKDWKKIRNHIRDSLRDNENLSSLYLLMDEADPLMKVELEKSKPEASFIRSISHMAEEIASSCNIRIVFAGLHNVTRMANDSNSVFGKFETIALEPFSSTDDINRGLKMITKPLAAMGYQFDDDNLPLQIMSVCNSYPAFIQTYCKRLVERLQNNRQMNKPPIMIKDTDLDAVEKDNKLLSSLREMFKLNLNLDKRYKAIALILAAAYYEQISVGQNIGLKLSEIREECEAFCSNHFTNTPPSVYEALLDEMIKLNVLQKVSNRYQLRNPHIAMMIGQKERIDDMLTELAEEKPEKDRSPGERYDKMHGKGNNSSLFPMPINWIRSRLSGTDGSYLIILTGNDLSGLKNLPSQDRNSWTLQSDDDYQTMLGKGTNSLDTQLATYRRNNKNIPRMIVVPENAWQIKDIGAFARLAKKAIEIGSGIRIMLIASPERALEMVKAKKIDGMDGMHPWKVNPVPVWSDDAIYYFNRENINIAEDKTALDAIKEATAGFTHLVEHLCNQSLTSAKAINAIKDNQNIYAPSLEVFYEKIGIPPSLVDEKGKQIKELLELIDGIDKSETGDIKEALEINEISENLFEFLKWMGLVQDGKNHTWKIPELFSGLFKGAK